MFGAVLRQTLISFVFLTCLCRQCVNSYIYNEYNDYQILYADPTPKAHFYSGDNVIITIGQNALSALPSIPKIENDEALELIIEKLDTYYNNLIRITGFEPTSQEQPFDEDKVAVSVADSPVEKFAINGLKGILISPEDLAQMYISAQENINDATVPFKISHSSLTTQAESFIDPDLMFQLYEVGNDDESQNLISGQFYQALINTIGPLLTEEIGTDFESEDGSNRESFKASKLEDFETYISQIQSSVYSYESVFEGESNALPWDNTKVISDVLSGLIVYFYDNYGKVEFLDRFWEASKIFREFDYINGGQNSRAQRHRDNLFMTFSIAASKNLSSFFENDMKFILSDSAKNFIRNNLATLSEIIAENSVAKAEEWENFEVDFQPGEYRESIKEQIDSEIDGLSEDGLSEDKDELEGDGLEGDRLEGETSGNATNTKTTTATNTGGEIGGNTDGSTSSSTPISTTVTPTSTLSPVATQTSTSYSKTKSVVYPSVTSTNTKRKKVKPKNIDPNCVSVHPSIPDSWCANVACDPVYS
eukprot:Awhi_evm1s6627